MRVDMHVHTWYSLDSMNSPSRLLKAMDEKGIDAIAVTDHKKTYAWRDFPKDRTIRGIEFSTDRGHVLGYFLEEDFRQRGIMTFYEALDFVRENDGIIVIAHPFDFHKSFEGLDDIINDVDGIEVCNGKVKMDKYNRKAYNIAKEYGKIMTAGSDAHFPWQVGLAYLEANVGDLEEFREHLEKGKTRVVCNRQPVYLTVALGALAAIQARFGIFGRPSSR